MRIVWLWWLQLLTRIGLPESRVRGFQVLANKILNRSRQFVRELPDGVAIFTIYLGRRLLVFINGLVSRLGLSIHRGVSNRLIEESLMMLYPGVSPMPLMRLGTQGDGGYLVPEDLEGLRASFSPGVDVNVDFDSAVAALGIPVFLADYSVEKPPVPNELFSFRKIFLGVQTDPTHMRLDDWVLKDAPKDGDLMLQMDIEGAEWQVLMDASKSCISRFRTMVVELHDLDSYITVKTLNPAFRGLMAKLLETHSIVHVHVNNALPLSRYRGFKLPRVIELTFLRNDRFVSDVREPVSSLPHPLDRPNVSYLRDVNPNKIWSRKIRKRTLSRDS